MNKESLFLFGCRDAVITLLRLKSCPVVTIAALCDYIVGALLLIIGEKAGDCGIVDTDCSYFGRAMVIVILLAFYTGLCGLTCRLESI